MKTVCVIPARLGSTRLTEKVLRPIAGRPMIQHTYERAKRVKSFDHVLVACDDARIVKTVEAFGGAVLLTRKAHESGTSRVSEAVEKLDFDLVVNVQADEPLIHPEALADLVQGMKTSSAEVGTLAVRSLTVSDWGNPHVVKVVLDHKGYALYFSRAPIPHRRDGSPPGSFLKHLGIYAYKRSVLLSYQNLKPSLLEEVEQLEQLRFLANGYRIQVWITPHESVGVDTAEDLERVEFTLTQAQVGR